MLKEKVQLNHEGISQLLFVLKEKCISLYAVVELAYATQMGTMFTNKASIFDVNLGKLSWKGILDQIDELYMIQFDSRKIYNVNVDDIKIFF